MMYRTVFEARLHGATHTFEGTLADTREYPASLGLSIRCSHPRARRHVQTGPYTGPVEDTRRPNPRAHGWVTILETCGRCGCTRHSNENGRSSEIGRWTNPNFWAERGGNR